MLKIALITGASSGLGREFTLQISRLYKHLDEIWVVARRADRLRELERELSIPVRIFEGDLTKDSVYETIEHALSECDANIRMLVNAAGFGKIGRFERISVYSQLKMIDLNCKALTRMTYLCIPHLYKNSRVINIASAAAFAPQPGFTVYAATKSYVYSFSIALDRELRKRNIYLTTICPGPVNTEFFDHTGKEIVSVKKKFRVDATDVVRLALWDSVNKHHVSVYGLPMRAARAACKFIPYSWIAWLMARTGNLKE